MQKAILRVLPYLSPSNAVALRFSRILCGHFLSRSSSTLHNTSLKSFAHTSSFDTLDAFTVNTKLFLIAIGTAMTMPMLDVIPFAPVFFQLDRVGCEPHSFFIDDFLWKYQIENDGYECGYCKTRLQMLSASHSTY
jgi:hypothetical protein